jgi:hypothetical protein
MKTAHILLSNGDMEHLSCSKRWCIQAKTNFPTESYIGPYGYPGYFVKQHDRPPRVSGLHCESV